MSDAPSILPPSAGKVERALEQATARVGAVPGDPRLLWDPATCPLALLPFLAWAFSVDWWRATWPEATKRAVIAAAARSHRLKGTVYAVRQALQALNARVVFQEWFETGGEPYTATARIFASGPNGAPQLSPELLADLEAAFFTSANARTHVELIFGVVFPPVPALGVTHVKPIEIGQLNMAVAPQPACLGHVVAGLRAITVARLQLEPRPFTQPLPPNDASGEPEQEAA